MFPSGCLGIHPPVWRVRARAAATTVCNGVVSVYLCQEFGEKAGPIGPLAGGGENQGSMAVQASIP